MSLKECHCIQQRLHDIQDLKQAHSAPTTIASRTDRGATSFPSPTQPLAAISSPLAAPCVNAQIGAHNATAVPDMADTLFQYRAWVGRERTIPRGDHRLHQVQLLGAALFQYRTSPSNSVGQYPLQLGQLRLPLLDAVQRVVRPGLAGAWARSVPGIA